MTADGGDRPLGAPRFDVVLRGYDRRQVDEHVARLQRVLGRMRADLDAARSQPFPAVGPQGMPPGGFPPGMPQNERPRPTPRPRPGGMPAPEGSPDMIGSFTDRMQSILQAAEEEAEEIRGAARVAAQREVEAARAAARHDNDTARAELADLVRQRDEVVAEFTRMRGQLEGLLSAPTAQFAAQSPRGQRPSPHAAPPAAEPGAAGQPLPGAHAGGGQPAPAKAGPGAHEAEADRTTAMRVRPEPDLFHSKDESGRSSEAQPAAAVPAPGGRAEDAPAKAPEAGERTTVVPVLKRGGDTGSAENAAPSGESADPDKTGLMPVRRPPETEERPEAGAEQTVAVRAVRPGPGPSPKGAPPKNPSSEGSDAAQKDGGPADRGGKPGGSGSNGRSGQSADQNRTDRSRSGSRSG
jgi:syndecan 1